MLKDGVFDAPTPGAIFGLHVAPMPSGHLYYRPGPAAAASDQFHIEVQGRGTHGAMPWGGSDAVSAAAQIVIGLQSIVSRRIDLTAAPAMISVGRLHAGSRVNVIPPTAEVSGTIRSFSEKDRELIHRLIPQIAQSSAENYGATATTGIESGYPVLVNDPQLGARMLPVLKAVAGERFNVAPMGTGSEDFGDFAQHVPGFYFVLGAAPAGSEIHMNHSPQFTVDEGALRTGVAALSRLALAYLSGGG
jgi:amidohydrolase